jgi:AcrR family transcriptional regulator
MKTGSKVKPGRPRSERRREEILEAAARVFAAHGYADGDTQVLADTLGVGKGTLYRYFPSKKALFLAAVDRLMRQLVGHVASAVTPVADPLERVGAAVRAFLGFCAERPEFVELLIQERAVFKDRKKPTFIEHREQNVERWRALYRGLIAAGRVRAIPVERITDVLSDLLYGTIFTNYFAGRRDPPEVQARNVLDVFFAGILSDDERRRPGPEKSP